MGIELLAINAAGLGLIVAIAWWFWIYRPEQEKLSGKQLEILVEDGVYQPSRISVPAHTAFTIQFLRKDPSNCAEQVVFPELKISANLALNQSRKIQLPPLEPGRYAFHCQMQMYRGQLEVM